MAHLLGVENLRIVVGSRTLLDGVTVGIEDGTRVGVLGPNGAGKSTFLQALSGQREIDGGRITRAADTRVAILNQSDNFPPGITRRPGPWQSPAAPLTLPRGPFMPACWQTWTWQPTSTPSQVVNAAASL